MLQFDILLTQGINRLAGSFPALDAVMLGMTYLGIPAMVLWTVFLWWSPQQRQFRRHVAISAGLSFILALVINQVILLFVHRLRPYDAGLTSLMVSTTTDPSFPSDHASASFAIAFSFLTKGLKRQASVLLVASVLICMSRIFVGTHYVTDTIGGMMTALLAVLLVSRLHRFGSRLDELITHLL